MRVKNSLNRRQFVLCGAVSTETSYLAAQQITDLQPQIIWHRLPNWLGTLSQTGSVVSPEAIPIETLEATALRLRAWVDLNLSLIVKYQQNPLRAARALAYLQVAMHDACRAVISNPSFSSSNPAQLLFKLEIAASRSAYGVLEQLYPNETPGIFAIHFAKSQRQMTQAYAQQTSFAPSADSVRIAQEQGSRVAELAIQRSLRDGAGRVWALSQRPADFPGIWQAAYPLYAVNPLEAFAGSWRPWVAPSKPLYIPPVAARLGSEQHTEETKEVWQVAQMLSPAQKEIAQYWHLEAGSVTPGGIWTTLAWNAGLDQLRSMSSASTGSIASISELLSAMSATAVAIHDAFIACWQVKYRDWSERPITAIRRQIQTDFAPLLVTPGFPAYVSGHATISAAAARTLGSWLPHRSHHFEALAQEAALSRLYGGIHFRSDNDQGLLLGRSVAENLLFKLRAQAISNCPSFKRITDRLHADDLAFAWLTG